MTAAPIFLHHSSSLEHDTGAHPEQAERIVAIERELEQLGWLGFERRQSPAVARETLTAVHRESYVDLIERAAARGGGALDMDTVMSAGSFDAALHAAGGAVRLVDLLLDGEAPSGFSSHRPPGHHAEPAQAMGFCLFNNIAIGALRAQRVHGCRRVAVIDFDVHHGNGTQAMFEADADLFYASTHQSPLYPGTGAGDETGVGNIVNVPLAPGSGTRQFQRAFTERILPALEAFRPDFLFISAGFDAHRRDPLAQLDLVEADYGWVTRELAHCAARHCAGRLVSSLEGGYDLAALGASAAVHVRALMAA